jgi:hypothetical protein
VTRRGTLAYYLAAWVIGTSCVAIVLWIIAAWSAQATGEPASASIFLWIDFQALIFGAPGALAFAFLLRRAMTWWGTHDLWKWLLMGAWLAVVPVLLLVPLYNRYSRSMNFDPGSLGFLLALVLAGPGLLSHAGLWQVPIEGAATAAVLCLVERAFNRPDEPAAAGDAKVPSA